jgi:hypothetical protein
VQELKENGNENEKTGVSCVANLARLKWIQIQLGTGHIVHHQSHLNKL